MIENLHRRGVLQIATVFGAMSALSPVKRALAQSPVRRTPDQILGPFYPVGKMPDAAGDLTHLPGKPGRAAGQVINLMGRVLTIKGEPVHDAKLEIWQANAAGRYTHSADANPAPLDPNFEGFAVLKTDAEGRYKLKTVMPGAYPAGPTLVRPPHIHIQLTGQVDKLTTQLYFEGEALNDKDPFLQSVPEPARSLLIAKLLPPTPELEPDSKLAVFDIVTLKG
jgi:protocatechuate 3,4-dioxygenase beta subunit